MNDILANFEFSSPGDSSGTFVQWVSGAQLQLVINTPPEEELSSTSIFMHWIGYNQYPRGANYVKCDKCEEWQKTILKCEEVKQWKNSP